MSYIAAKVRKHYFIDQRVEEPDAVERLINVSTPFILEDAV